MEHLTGHRVLPSTEEELTQILEQRAKKEVERQLAADIPRIAAEQHGVDPPEVVQAGIATTFRRKVREAVWAAGATKDQAPEAEEKDVAEAEASLSATSAMRD